MMNFDSALTGRRRRQRTSGDRAVLSNRSLKLCMQSTPSGDRVAESPMLLVGPGWSRADFSTLFRRQKTLAANNSCHACKAPLHVLMPSRDIAARCPAGAVDSVSIKVEGKWPTRKGGSSYQRDWRNMQLGTVKEKPEIRACGITESRICDAPVSLNRLRKVPAGETVVRITSDGGSDRRHDRRKRHKVITVLGARGVSQPWAKRNIGVQPVCATERRRLFGTFGNFSTTAAWSERSYTASHARYGLVMWSWTSPD